MPSALIVHHDPEYADIIRPIVESIWGNVDWSQATNAEDGTKLLSGACDLLVADRDIAENGESPRDPDSHFGLALADKGASKHPRLAIVVLASHADDETHRRGNLYPFFRSVLYGSTFGSELASALNQLRLILERGGQPTGEWPHEKQPAVVHVSIQNGIRLCRLKYADRLGRPMHVEEKFELSQESVDRLTALAQVLKQTYSFLDYKLWESLLRECGTQLNEAISRSATLHAKLAELLGLGDASEILFFFHTDKQHYPIVYEAFVRDGIFFSLRAPFARRLRTGQIRGYPLLWGRGRKVAGPLRCLIVEANVQGDYGRSRLRRLTHLSQECVEVARFDSRTGDRRTEVKRAVEVTHITTGNSIAALPNGASERYGGREFRDAVFTELKKSWDIVHFAGHSQHCGETGVGHVFFPGAEVGEVEAVPVRAFVEPLMDVGLMYLSSCESSGEDMVFSLADQCVPAVIGFRWPVADEVALGFAQALYKGILAGGQSLGVAFASARRSLKEAYYDRPHWIAPVLVVQHDESEAQATPFGYGQLYAPRTGL